MLSSNPDRLRSLSVPISTSWLLGACMECRGKQQLFLRQKPEIIRGLREQAIIQSAESSNRIEGITVEPKRLRPIIVGNSRPRDRSEQEIVGYRKALNWIFARKQNVDVASRTILRLHEMAQGGSISDAGKWKTKNNEIIEILPNGERRIRFVPEPAASTPEAVEKLCESYRFLIDEERIPTLIIIATYIFDFLCIHPFRDGNGRVSRLLTMLLLSVHGFEVGRYVSLERIVEETKEDYYRVLEQCSKGWHEGHNELVPWWNYFLGMLHTAYRDLERSIEETEGAGKSDLVRQAIDRQVGDFTLSELAAQCPSVSTQLVKKVLQQEKNAGNLRLTGKGRGAKWRPKTT